MMTTRDAILEEYGLDIQNDSVEQIRNRIRMIKEEVRMYENEIMRFKNDERQKKRLITDNQKKIEMSKQLPYLVATVQEVLDESEINKSVKDEGNAIDRHAQRKGKSVVIKTTTRRTIYLPVTGLVPAKKLKPGELIGVNKDSYLILDTLPVEYDSRVKAMEVDTKPTEDYKDIGGLDKQIKELYEAIVLPIEHADRFIKIGINPPKGVLLYGEPGTGKTLLARACAAQTKATFLRLSATALVAMYIGDGAKLVRDAFELAKSKQPTIVFIDEIDAIGGRRFGGEKSGDREVQRTMLELLSQMDGFDKTSQVKIIAATNRIDILDPALLRSGRIDRKIEFPLPDETARARILKIHSRKMNISKDVNFEELARVCDGFNGAQMKAVAMEGGMKALKRESSRVTHSDFQEGIAEVMRKKKNEHQQIFA